MPRASNTSVLCDCTMYERDHLVPYRTRTRHRENYPRRFALKYAPNVTSQRPESPFDPLEPFSDDIYDDAEELNSDNSMKDDVFLEGILDNEEIDGGSRGAEYESEEETQSTIGDRESNDGSDDDSEYYDSELGKEQFHSNNTDPDLHQLKALSSNTPVAADC